MTIARACTRPSRRSTTRNPSCAGRRPRSANANATPRRSAAPRPCSNRPASANCAASPVFTTPNYFPPAELPIAPTVDAGDDESARAAALLRLQAEVHTDPSLLRPAVPGVRRVQLRQAHRTGRPRRPRRAADRRARQDRLPGRPQAAARRRAPDRHHALPARFRRALRAGAGLRRVGPSAGGLRPRPAPHAERRGVLPRAARHAAAARLHRQQRLPDRAPPAGVLRAHDGGRDRGAARHARSTCASCSALRGPARLPHAAGRRRVGAAGRDRQRAARDAPASPARPSCRRCRCCPRNCSGQKHLFPEGRLDQDLQQVDLRGRNSWRLLTATRCRRWNCSRCSW